jgi:hypothetical protein
MDHGSTSSFLPAKTAAAAGWIVASLRAWDGSVASIVPVCFEAYARVFYPASRMLTNPCKMRSHDAELLSEPIRWAEIAAANRRRMHPTAQWESIIGPLDYERSGGQPGIWDEPPRPGPPPLPVAIRLATALVAFTDTPRDCSFGISEIWGSPLYASLQSAARFWTPIRAWRLLRGPLKAALVSPHLGSADRHLLPDIWWPDDRGWFVSSDPDLRCAYIGASDACIRALLQDTSLETHRVRPDDGVTGDSDTINPVPPRQHG